MLELEEFWTDDEEDEYKEDWKEEMDDGEEEDEEEPEMKDEEKTSPAFKEFMPMYGALKSQYKEKYEPYHASLFVGYFPPGKVDKGPMATYAMKKRPDNFKAFLYFANSTQKDTCIHLSGQDNKEEKSRLVKLMKKGVNFWRQVYNACSNFLG